MQPPPTIPPRKRNTRAGNLLLILIPAILLLAGAGMWAFVWFNQPRETEYVEYYEETTEVEVEYDPAEPTETETTQVTLSLDYGSAEDFIIEYYETCMSDPELAWEMMSDSMHASTTYSEFVEWWNTVESYDFENFNYSEISSDSGYATVDIVVTLDSGETQTLSDYYFWLTQCQKQICLDAQGNPDSEYQINAEARLEKYRQEDSAYWSTNGDWVAVLSTKNRGITDEKQYAENGTHTFFDSDILAIHEDLVDRFDGGGINVLLVKTTDFGKQPKDGTVYWRTMATGFSSEEDVQSWCNSTFSGSQEDIDNSCLARQLVDPYE